MVHAQRQVSISSPHFHNLMDESTSHLFPLISLSEGTVPGSDVSASSSHSLIIGTKATISATSSLH